MPLRRLLYVRLILAAAMLVATTSPLAAAERPKLIVVLSVDQLCQDYLVRFADNFSDSGAFRRVAREGVPNLLERHLELQSTGDPVHTLPVEG